MWWYHAETCRDKMKGIHRSPKKNEFVIDYDYIKSGGKNQGQAQSSRL